LISVVLSDSEWNEQKSLSSADVVQGSV